MAHNELKFLIGFPLATMCVEEGEMMNKSAGTNLCLVG